MIPSTIITALFAAAASFVSAAPTDKSVQKRGGVEHERFYPDLKIQIDEFNPDHAYYNGDWGLVSRTNGANNVQTLVSIYLPSHVEGQSCRLVFSDPHDIGGSAQIQVFTVGDIAYASTYNSRPHRDRHVATFKVTWDEAKVNTFGTKSFPCPADGRLNYELVPVGDNDFVQWYGTNGFAVEAYETGTHEYQDEWF